MNTKKMRRQNRVRKNIKAVGDRLRLSVHKSNQYLSAQLIDDKTGISLFGVSEKKLESNGSRMERAKELGMKVAALAKEKKVKAIVFDKGRYAYHGRVKALAEGAREGGLQF